MLKKKGLGEKIKTLFGIGNKDEAFFEELEDILIEGDLGAVTALDAVSELRERIKTKKLKNESCFLSEMKSILESSVKVNNLRPEKNQLNLYLILGVNGVGKTTVIARMANYFMKNCGINKIVLSAGDTFRAAAIEQLKLHGNNLGLKVIHQDPGSDPGAVIYDSISSAEAKGMELVIADTAGRMHNKENLVKELVKINKIVCQRVDQNNYKKILVIDATTGQNAFRQAEIFHEAVGIDSIIIAKYDSTAKGGIVIPICRQLGIPFSFMGVGEKIDDLIPFDKEEYLNSLVGLS